MGIELQISVDLDVGVTSFIAGDAVSVVDAKAAECIDIVAILWRQYCWERGACFCIF